MHRGTEVNLPFMAVGRLEGEVTLATYVNDSVQDSGATDNDPRAVFRKLLKAAKKKLKRGERTRLQWNDGSVVCILDMQGELLYCVVTADLHYPERLAYGCLNDLMQFVRSELRSDLNDVTEDNLLPRMKEICTRYEKREEWEKLSAALNHVSDVQQNLKATQQAHNDTKDVVNEMSHNAQSLHKKEAFLTKQANDLEQTYKNRNMKIVLCAILAIVAVIALVGGAVAGTYGSSEASDSKASDSGVALF